MDKCCRACDGRGSRKVTDKENVFKVTVSQCGPCGGSGKIRPPSDKRGFRRRQPKSEDDDNDLDQAADRFLASRGYGRNGQ